MKRQKSDSSAFPQEKGVDLGAESKLSVFTMADPLYEFL